MEWREIAHVLGQHHNESLEEDIIRQYVSDKVKQYVNNTPDWIERTEYRDDDIPDRISIEPSLLTVDWYEIDQTRLGQTYSVQIVAYYTKKVFLDGHSKYLSTIHVMVSLTADIHTTARSGELDIQIGRFK